MTALVSSTVLDRSAPAAAKRSRKAVVAGRILSGVGVLFLGWDAAMKLLAVAPAVEGTTDLGYRVTAIRPIGLIELACLIVYLVRPRRDPVDRLPRRGRRDPCSHREPALHARPLSHLHRFVLVGGPLAAG